MNNSYFWISLFSSTALFHAGTPIHFAFSASSYVDKQTNKQTNKKQTNHYAGIHYWITVILQLWKSTLPWGLNWQSIRIKLGPLYLSCWVDHHFLYISHQWQLLCKNYRPYKGWPKHLSNIGKTKRDQFPVTTSFQTEDVYLFLANVISIPCKIYISSIIIDNAS